MTEEIRQNGCTVLASCSEHAIPHDFQQSVREELFGQGIPGLYPVYSTR